MPLDVAIISAVREELCALVLGMKIDKVLQPQRDLIILNLRGKAGDVRKLLISAGISDMRVHLTEHVFENPASPPMFCMLLRKHLTGARIEAIGQPPNERILEFILKASTAMGDASVKRLVIELFGRIPNIILTGSDGIIIDCLRRIGGDMQCGAPAGKRMILPGLRYNAPEPVEPDNIRPPSGEIPKGGSISKALDAAYTSKAKEDSLRRRGRAMTKAMKTAGKRVSQRLAAQKAELEQTDGRDFLRECADIIMANMHRIKKGDEVLVADDFYAVGDDKREIKLDPLLTPQKNAAKYYKMYTKARNAARHLKEQIERGEAELMYIESVIEQLGRAESEQDFMDIRDELTQTKYIKAGTDKAQKAKKTESKPHVFRSSGGMQILAGKNNLQNDKLTMKVASKPDIWLHAQKIHGAHVVVRCGGKEADDATLREAAAIAAFYSAARGSGTVPVDYTYVKNVKKPPGARIGMVIYSDFKTITATPDEDLVQRLKV